MRKNKKLKVLYITGNGHSGSTLLDIIIGSSPSIFSAGELGYITRESIFKEFCSCKEEIGNCPLWSKILDRWLSKIDISIEDYRELRWRYERNKATIRVFKNFLIPSKNFKIYCEATLALFEAIQEETGKSVIVDSTKLPQRIPVLSRIVDLRVIHICRNAKGVLNSAKNSAKKNIEAGIETELLPRRTFKTLLEWIFVNMATAIFSIKVPYTKVKYKDYLKNIRSLEAIDDSIRINQTQFSSPHMLAGNVLRLNKNIKINPELGFRYQRLSPKQKKIAHLLDLLFPYWS